MISFWVPPNYRPEDLRNCPVYMEAWQNTVENRDSFALGVECYTLCSVSFALSAECYALNGTALLYVLRALL